MRFLRVELWQLGHSLFQYIWMFTASIEADSLAATSFNIVFGQTAGKEVVLCLVTISQV